MKIWNRLFKTAANDRYEPHVCEQCNAEWPDMIMLKEDVWLSIAEKEDFLCKDCIEKRLGRPLTGWDLKDWPLNHEIWPHLMYEVLQHTSYAESYRRMFLEHRTQPMLILMGLIRGYVMPMQEGFDNDDPLAADRELDEERKKFLLSSLRWLYGIDDTANDNDPDADLKEPAA